MAQSQQTTTNGAKKTTCPITRERFRAKAPRALVVSVAGAPLSAELKEYDSGSLGYMINEKTTIVIDGVPCRAQVGLNITLVGSKDLPK